MVGGVAADNSLRRPSPSPTWVAVISRTVEMLDNNVFDTFRRRLAVGVDLAL